MSNVISFWLNEDNPREAKAIQVLNTRIERGFSVRYVITEALLRLGDIEVKPETTKVEGLNETLLHISQLLEQLGGEKLSPNTNRNSGTEQLRVSEVFITSVKNAARPGLMIE